MIYVKRAYEPLENNDGKRFLVDRLWPRGLKKTQLKIDRWLKNVSPSTFLRQEFCHDPDKWEEFQQRYFAELDAKPEAWTPLCRAAQDGDITLVYSAADTEYNNAVALRSYLIGELKKARTQHRKPVPA